MIQNIALLLSFVGYYLINKRKKSGYIIWILQNILWIVYFIPKKEYQQLIMWGAYILFNVHGIYCINKNNKEAQNG